MAEVRLSNEQIEFIKVYSHLPDPAILKIELYSALIDRAAIADETPRQTKTTAQKDISIETADNIPAYNSNQRTVNKIQQNRVASQVYMIFCIVTCRITADEV